MIYKLCLLLLFTEYSIKYLDDFQNVSIEDSCIVVYEIAIGASTFLQLNPRQFVSIQRLLIKIWFHMEITVKKVSSPTKSDHDHVKICTKSYFQLFWTVQLLNELHQAHMQICNGYRFRAFFSSCECMRIVPQQADDQAHMQMCNGYRFMTFFSSCECMGIVPQ